MSSWHAIGFFCEDIREEKDDLYTLVGIIPDNMSVPSTPGTVAKMGIYVRFHISPLEEIGQIMLKIKFPNGDESILSILDKDLVRRAQADAIVKENTWAGLIVKVIAAPMMIKMPGRILLLATISGEDVVCGSLNVEINNASVPNVSSPPAARP